MRTVFESLDVEGSGCYAGDFGAHLMAHFSEDDNKNYALSIQAREPKGKSEIPTETFGDVFSRIQAMGDIRIDWEAAKQFFTNRGLPLSILAKS